MAEERGITLLIMAAGIGRRFGGPKQIEPVGPSGEIIIDYSIHDALKAGFGRVVLIISHEIEAAVKELLGQRYKGRVELEYVFQELGGLLPDGFEIPQRRDKPWGTGHAILMAEDCVKEPFAVINADDFYGADAFVQMASYLRGLSGPASTDYAMVGYALASTLSEHGTVSRGVCECDGQGFLRSIVERHGVGKDPQGFFYTDSDGQRHPLRGDETVSMNFWGFTPALFPQLREGFESFLRVSGSSAKDEFLIPTAVDDLLRAGACRVKVLSTTAEWAGITNRADLEPMRRRIQSYVEKGAYTSPLWQPAATKYTTC